MNPLDIPSTSHDAVIASAAAYFPDPDSLVEVGDARVHVQAILPFVSDRELIREELALLMTLPPVIVEPWEN